MTDSQTDRQEQRSEREAKAETEKERQTDRRGQSERRTVAWYRLPRGILFTPGNTASHDRDWEAMGMSVNFTT